MALGLASARPGRRHHGHIRPAILARLTLRLPELPAHQQERRNRHHHQENDRANDESVHAPSLARLHPRAMTPPIDAAANAPIVLRNHTLGRGIG